MRGYGLGYNNENEFKKLERALKKKNILAYKKLNFEYYPALRNGKFVGTLISECKNVKVKTYELKLPCDQAFINEHGDLKLLYDVYEDSRTIMLDKITPADVLLEGIKTQYTTYKGIMMSKENASKDMFKLDLLKTLHDKK